METKESFAGWLSDIWFFAKSGLWNIVWFDVKSLFHYMYWKYFLGFVLWLLRSWKENYRNPFNREGI